MEGEWWKRDLSIKEETKKDPEEDKDHSLESGLKGEEDRGEIMESKEKNFFYFNVSNISSTVETQIWGEEEIRNQIQFLKERLKN